MKKSLITICLAVGIALPAADQPAGQHRAVADRAAGQRAADR